MKCKILFNCFTTFGWHNIPNVWIPVINAGNWKSPNDGWMLSSLTSFIKEALSSKAYLIYRRVCFHSYSFISHISWNHYNIPLTGGIFNIFSHFQSRCPFNLHISHENHQWLDGWSMDPQISQRQPFGSSFASSAPAEERPKHGASGSTGAQQFLLDVWLYNAIDMYMFWIYIYKYVINCHCIIYICYVGILYMKQYIIYEIYESNVRNNL